jgi:hypothetical protein
MNTALRITDENNADLFGILVQNCLKRELGSLCECLAFIQNDEPRGFEGRICLKRCPGGSQEWKDFLANRFKRPLVCGIHRNTHKCLLILPDLTDEPLGRGCFSRTWGAEEEEMLKRRGIFNKRVKTYFDTGTPEIFRYYGCHSID